SLVRRREIGPLLLQLALREPFHGVEESGLQPGEREVEPWHLCDRERERGLVSVLRKPVDRRSPGIAESEQASALVERLAGRVVEGRPEQLARAALSDGQELRVTPA